MNVPQEKESDPCKGCEKDASNNNLCLYCWTFKKQLKDRGTIQNVY